MRKSSRSFCLAAILGVCCLWALPSIALAESVLGQAAIQQGNLAEAREEARKDAMRTFVEQHVGVRVESLSVNISNMLVRDQVTASSEGYVQVNRIEREWQADGVYFMQLDLTADDKKIQTAARDLRDRLEAMDENASRSGIQVAVAGRDAQGPYRNQAELNRYLQAKLQETGFRVVVSDPVLAYLAVHADDPAAGLEARRLARVNRTDGNALLRGSLYTLRVTPRGGSYEAIVSASFELIGLDTDNVDTFAKYFTAVAPSAAEAEYKAADRAVQEAAEALGQQALRTVQSEYRGGVKHLRTLLRFRGLPDAAAQRTTILSGLAACGCKVIRTSVLSDGSFQVFVSNEAFSDLEELRAAVLQNIVGIQQGVDDTTELGSSRLEFQFVGGASG